MTNAAQAYHDMTDEQIVAFVAAHLPAILWRIEKRPRCFIHRDAIIAALHKHLSEGPMQGAFADWNRAAGHIS